VHEAFIEVQLNLFLTGDIRVFVRDPFRGNISHEELSTEVRKEFVGQSPVSTQTLDLAFNLFVGVVCTFDRENASGNNG
jgi:hypothetical protein